MNENTKFAIPPVQKSSKTSTTSANQPGLGVQPPSAPSEKRARKPRPLLPAWVVLGFCFVLLLLGIAGAGVYQYHLNYVGVVRTCSSVPKPSSVTSGGGSLSKPGASGVSTSILETSRHPKGIQQALSKHPRPLIMAVLVLILAAALVAAVVMLAKALGAPPQVIEKDDTIIPYNNALANPADRSMPVGGIVGITLGTLSSVALIGVIAYCRLKKPQTILVRGVVVRVPVSDQEMAILAGNNAKSMKTYIQVLFERAARLVQEKEGDWNAVNAVPPNTPPNMAVSTLHRCWENRHEINCHMKVNQAWLPWQYFHKMLQYRRTLPQTIGNQFALMVERRGSGFIDPDEQIDPGDSVFDVVTLDNIDEHNTVRLIFICNYLLTSLAYIRAHCQPNQNNNIQLVTNDND